MRILKLAFLRANSELIALTLRARGVEIGERPWILGLPRVKLVRQSSVTIGKNVSIFSAPFANPLFPEQRTVLHSALEGAAIRIDDEAGISATTIVAHREVTIGARTIIGAGCLITDTDFHPLLAEDRRHPGAPGKVRPVTIGPDVFIGARSIVLKGVEIGEGAVIGAGSVVVKSVPPRSVAAGNPAQVVRHLS